MRIVKRKIFIQPVHFLDRHCRFHSLAQRFKQKEFQFGDEGEFKATPAMKAVLNRVKDITLTTDKMVRWDIVLFLFFQFFDSMCAATFGDVHLTLCARVLQIDFPVGRYEGRHQGAAGRRAQGQRRPAPLLEVSGVQARPHAPLLRVPGVHAQDGPPLPLGRQLVRWRL